MKECFSFNITPLTESPLDVLNYRLSSSDPIWVVEFASIAAMVMQIEGA